MASKSGGAGDGGGNGGPTGAPADGVDRGMLLPGGAVEAEALWDAAASTEAAAAVS